jgi:hypothetical protein
MATMPWLSSTLAGANQATVGLAGPSSNAGDFGLAEQGIGAIATGAAAAVAAAGGAASAAASGGILLAATAAGPFAAIAIPVLILLSRLFKGADPRQVPASEIEQMFEAAADNFYALAKVGMIDIQDAAHAMQILIEQGAAYYQKVPNLGRAGGKGIANMTAVIQAEIDATLALPSNIPVIPVDIAVAHGYYISGAGWYASSIAGANKLTDNFLVSYSRSPISLSGITNVVKSFLGSGGSGSVLGLGLILGGVVFFGVIKHLWILAALVGGAGFLAYKNVQTKPSNNTTGM